jgi:hypothetical protein
MFGASEDRARQLAARTRRARQSSSSSYGSSRVTSVSSQLPMPPFSEHLNQQSQAMIQQPGSFPLQSSLHRQRRVHTLPSNTQLFTNPRQAPPHSSQPLMETPSHYIPHGLLRSKHSPQAHPGAPSNIQMPPTMAPNSLARFFTTFNIGVNAYNAGYNAAGAQSWTLPIPRTRAEAVSSGATQYPSRLPTWTYAVQALTYFEWDDMVEMTKTFSLWNEPITTQNTPGFGSFYNDLSEVEKRSFLLAFHGNPWGPLSDVLTAREKRTWFQSLSQGKQLTFIRLVSCRQNTVGNAGPDAPVAYSTLTMSRPSMMLWEALEAIETRYNSYIIYTDGSRAPLPRRSASSPFLGTAGDGSTDLRSYSTYWSFCLSLLCFLSRQPAISHTVIVNQCVQILCWRRRRRFDSFTRGQEHAKQVV